MLTGGVGEDPDAFAITLTEESGNEVSTLLACMYRLQIDDLSTIHSFRLSGPGAEETTTRRGDRTQSPGPSG